MPPAPTLRDVARLSGFSLASVSMALRDDPRIQAETRRVVHEVAARLGYESRPIIRDLMRRVRHRERANDPVKLAHVLAWTRRQDYYAQPAFREFHRGAQARAKEFGYVLDDFVLDEVELKQGRLNGILRARAVPGLLIAPVQMPDSAHPELQAGLNALDLAHCAATTIGFTLQSPRVSRAVHDHVQGAQLAFRTLESRGYRRIGFVSSVLMNRRVRGRWLAGYVCAQQEQEDGARLAPLLMAELLDNTVFDRWLDRWKPDAIITIDYGPVRDHLRRRGRGIPENVALVHLEWREDDEPRAGIDQRTSAVGAAAIDMLLAQLGRHERGVPEFPKTVLVEGRWVDGPTVRSSS